MGGRLKRTPHAKDRWIPRGFHLVTWFGMLNVSEQRCNNVNILLEQHVTPTLEWSQNASGVFWYLFTINNVYRCLVIRRFDCEPNRTRTYIYPKFGGSIHYGRHATSSQCYIYFYRFLCPLISGHYDTLSSVNHQNRLSFLSFVDVKPAASQTYVSLVCQLVSTWQLRFSQTLP